MADFPEHTPPKGSSKKILTNLSARYSAGGRAQEFTVGSRATESDGVAAMGSRLEASAMSMKPRKAKKKT